MKEKVTGEILSQEKIADGIYDMWIRTHLAEEAFPGQFICIYPRDKSTLLPRPISICQLSDDRKGLRIVYRVAGKGTTEFSSYQRGEKIELLGVLGNGFPLTEAEGKRALLLGGGIGIPPLVQLAGELKAQELYTAAGYRDSQLFLKQELEAAGRLYIATEDGSVGTKGNVLDAVRQNDLEADVIYACGPMPMLRAVKQYAARKGIRAFISLEEHMACGVGACLGCVVKTNKIDSHSHVHNSRICTDGPVFEAQEVDI